MTRTLPSLANLSATYPRMPSFFVGLCLLLFFIPNGSTGHAEETKEETKKEEKPLPQRTQPVPKIDGYGPWKFTDSFETLKKDKRLTFIQKGQLKCEFGRDENADEATLPDCFYQSTEIFQEAAEIFLLVDNETLQQIEIHFDRDESEKDSKACASVLNTVVDQLVKKFGVPTGKDDKARTVWWESPLGGRLEFRNGCISEDRGRIQFVISPTTEENLKPS